jgi:type II restriction enzyme
MILNFTSKKQESAVALALKEVILRIEDEFVLAMDHRSDWNLQELISDLRNDFPDVAFADALPRSSMRPDGGILSIVGRNGRFHPILITEVKNQGTNDLRAAEGLGRQAKGNAIERLGKNVIGFRTGMLSEGIMPFVCFGYGCDFAEGSSILDRVVTIAMFGPLNAINVVPEGEGGQFNRGSYFFREPEWTIDEMVEVMYEVASRSVHYYLAKYGSQYFRKRQVVLS